MVSDCSLDIDCSGIPDPSTDLLEASENGNLTGVELLIQCNETDVNIISSHLLDTPLIYAVENGHLSVMEVLLAHPKLDVNKQPNEKSLLGWSKNALFVASENGNSRAVKLLLEHPQIEVNIRNYDTSDAIYGETPIYIASKYGYVEVVKLLLGNSDIDVNKKDTVFGGPPLVEAALNGFSEVVKLLISHPQLDVNLESFANQTALWETYKRNHSEVIKILLNHPKINPEKGAPTEKKYVYIASLLFDHHVLDNISAKENLMIAAVTGNINEIKEIIHENATDINMIDNGGRTLLFWASQRGHSEIVHLLLNQSKIDVNKAEPETGKTPLLMSSINNHSIVVRLLINCKQIDVNKDTINRETPLMLASQRGYSSVVKMLLAHRNIDVSFATFEGKTALFYAFTKSNEAEQTQIEVVRLILRCLSIDLSKRDNDFKTALDYAKEKNRTDLIKTFESRGVLIKQHGHTCCSHEVNNGLQKAAKEGDLAMVKAFLLCSQVDINHGYEFGMTPLYMGSMNYHVEVVHTLLDDPRIYVNVIVNSENALFVASKRGHIEIVDQLLGHPQLDVNKENTRNKKTALFIASEEGHSDIVRKLLLSPQINVNKLDSYGDSAFQKASLMGHLTVVKLLLRCSMTNILMGEIKSGNDVYLEDISVAVENRHTLYQVGPTCCLNANDNLLGASWDGDFRAIRGTLLCPDSDVNVRNVKGRTPSYLSSLRGHIQSLKVLLESPYVDPNKGMKIDGSTAFSIASEKGNFHIMQELIKHIKTDVGKGWCADNWTPHRILCDHIEEMTKSTASPTTNPG